MVVLMATWRGRVMVGANMAREYAAEVGMAASLGLITTRVRPGIYTRQWHITRKGLEWLEGRQ
jgi:hypothetical protein